MEIQNLVTKDEVQSIIKTEFQNYSQDDDSGIKSPELSYYTLKHLLVKFLINEKKIKFKKLFSNNNFCIPIERINNFLNFIEVETDFKYEKNS